MKVVIETTNWQDILLIRTVFNKADNRIIDISSSLYERYKMSMNEFHSIQREIKEARMDMIYGREV